MSAVKKTQKIFKKITTLKGLVNDDHGLVKTGVINATNHQNQLIATTELQADGSYRIDIPKNTVLPILLTVYQPADSLKNQALIAVVAYTSMTKFHINPLSTKIAYKAQALGGYSHANLVLAVQSIIGKPDNKKSMQGFRGDPTKQYGGWH
jgi:hypothetical protein